MENKSITYADALKSAEFKNEIAKELQAIHNSRLGISIPTDCRLKRSPFDSLSEKKLLNVDSLIICYTLILTKSLEGVSSSERKMVGAVCQPAFERACNRLIANQK